MKRLGWLPCVLALAVGAGACNGNANDANDDGTADTDTAQTDTGMTGTAGDGTVRVADVVAAPNEYFGRTVTLEADVEEVLGARAFTLDEDAAFAGGIDNDLLVLGAKTGNLEAIDDQWLNNRVRVTGTVGRMSVVEIERELGWDLDPELEVELERAGAVLIASSVNRVELGSRSGERYMGNQQAGRQQARAELPDSASWAPAIAILGLLSMGGALGVRHLRRK